MTYEIVSASVTIIFGISPIAFRKWFVANVRVFQDKVFHNHYGKKEIEGAGLDSTLRIFYEFTVCVSCWLFSWIKEEFNHQEWLSAFYLFADSSGLNSIVIKGALEHGRVGASALGFNAFEQIGRVGGVFNGVITNSATGYSAVGTFTPYTDTYDFNNDPTRGRAANGAAVIGRFGGSLAN